MQFLVLFNIIGAFALPLVKRVLVGLGIGAVSMVGINVLLQGVEAYVKSSFSGAAPSVLAILGLAKVDIAINIMLAAIATRALIAGMNKANGSIKKIGNVGQGS